MSSYGLAAWLCVFRVSLLCQAAAEAIHHDASSEHAHETTLARLREELAAGKVRWHDESAGACA